MIPQKRTGGVEIDGLTGERAQFTIAANGKAFRTLIDGLYSNKIQAVTRELWSNAADSHIEAGCPDRPFLASVPTTLDPTFRVRDYGTGLSHEGVMRLYTTIFESTKEGTNDQTGMLGLGSKSPFAYTDTFSVIAYDGTTKRVYVANIASDGVPSITHISNSPCTEPRGLEVSFPVNRTDIRTFHQEAQWVALGFKVRPLIGGMDLKFPKPRMSGPTWAVYPRNSFDGTAGRSNNLIRQGVACYPNDTIAIPGLAYNWTVIIDVPIGTCDVTASRESLSYTPDTKLRVKRIIEQVSTEIVSKIQTEIAAAKTRRQKAQVYLDFNGIMSTVRGSTLVSLMDDLYNYNPAMSNNDNGPYRRPGDMVAVGPHYGKSATTRGYHIVHKSAEEVQLLDRVRLFVDYDKPMVRKTKRIREYCFQPTDFIVKAEVNSNGDEIAADWIIQCWELKPEQVFDVADCPDPGPPARTGKTVQGKKVLAKGQYWMLRKNGITDTVYGAGAMKDDFAGWPKAMRTAFSRHLSDSNPLKLGTVPADILYVTPLQQERMALPQDRRYDVALLAALQDQVSKSPVDESLSVQILHAELDSGTYQVVVEQFFPNLKGMDYVAAHKLIETAQYARINLQNNKIATTVREQIRVLSATYPLLFGKSDKRVFEEYIKQVQLANSMKEVQPA